MKSAGRQYGMKKYIWTRGVVGAGGSRRHGRQPQAWEAAVNSDHRDLTHLA